MDASKPWKNVNLRDLYNCPWFFGQLSEENATEILTEALQKDGNFGVKMCYNWWISDFARSST